MTLLELETIVEKHMLLADKGLVKLVCSHIVASKLPIDPPWLFLVGSSAGGKSMLLSALEGIPGIFPLDDLTPNTFFSGMKSKEGEEMSLIDRLLPNSVLTFKDFTTILSKQQDARAMIIGQLRKIYDGDFSKQYGNGKAIKWKGKLSILAGVTSKVYTTMHQFQDMGERFLMYTFEQPDRFEVGMIATEQLDKRIGREEMRKAFKEFLAGINIPKEAHNVDKETRTRIVELSEFTTRARSAIERDERSRDRAIRFVHMLEMPSRFAAQLLALSLGMMVINGNKELTDFDRQIIYKVALDSIPDTRRRVLQVLTRFAKVETKAVGLKLQLPTNTVREALQELAALKLVDYTEASNKHDNWELLTSYRLLMAKYEKIELTDDILIDEDFEEPTSDEDPGPVDPRVQQAIDIMGGEVML